MTEVEEGGGGVESNVHMHAWRGREQVEGEGAGD